MVGTRIYKRRTHSNESTGNNFTNGSSQELPSLSKKQRNAHIKTELAPEVQGRAALQVKIVQYKYDDHPAQQQQMTTMHTSCLGNVSAFKAICCLGGCCPSRPAFVLRPFHHSKGRQKRWAPEFLSTLCPAASCTHPSSSVWGWLYAGPSGFNFSLWNRSAAQQGLLYL